jgi:hypothetical protein
MLEHHNLIINVWGFKYRYFITDAGQAFARIINTEHFALTDIGMGYKIQVI